MIFFTIFSGAIICDCQTVNVISNKDGQGTYQKLGYVNGRTSWNSSTGDAVWYSQTYEGWFFGSMDWIGQDVAFLLTYWTGNDSCPYNISDDKWLYYDWGSWSWEYVNVGDVSIECLAGKFDKYFCKIKDLLMFIYPIFVLILSSFDTFKIVSKF